jgi:hypothetical protein
VELFVPPRRYPGGFVLRCDGAPVTRPRSTAIGKVTFRCGRARGERLVELAPAP